MKLDTTTRKLQVTLAGTVSTTACPIVVCYRDENRNAPQNLGAVPSATMPTTVSSATAVDILTAPNVNTIVRVPERISLKNLDVLTVTPTFRLNDNGTTYPFWSPTLLTGESAFYDEGRGWYALDANGNFKTSQNNAITGAFTPSDASGAGLVFTSVAGFYSVSNGIWDVWGQLVYPVTASGANAVIGGLPANVGAGAVSRNGFFPSFTTEATLIHMLGNAGTTNFGLYTAAGAAITNVTMSTDQLNFYGRFYT